MAVDHQIISNLLAHEGREDVTPSSPLAEEEAEYSSSSDEISTGVYIDKDSAKEDSSEEDELTVRVRSQILDLTLLQYKFCIELKSDNRMPA